MGDGVGVQDGRNGVGWGGGGAFYLFPFFFFFLSFFSQTFTSVKMWTEQMLKSENPQIKTMSG